MAKVNQQNLKLPELFANIAFRIPRYQRGYAWGDKQWGDLWDDIMEIEKDKDGDYRCHYTGTIALKEIQKKEVPDEELWLRQNGSIFYDVVDGQQRLTTIMILMYEIIRAYDDNYPEDKEQLQEKYLFKKKKGSGNKVYLFSYKKEDQNRQFLLNRVYEDDTEILLSNYRNVYTNNLQNAQTFFRDKVERLSIEERIDLLDRMQNALVFDTKYIDDELSVQAVFETMNNRGKQLTILEKLKNRLLFLAAKLNNDIDDINILSAKINDAWRNIYDYLGKNPNGVLDEDEFLSAHLSVYRKPADYTFSEVVAEQKVFEMFCNRAQNYLLDYTRGQGNDAKHENAVDYNKIENYVLDISQFVEFWYKAVNSDDLRIQKILYLNSSKEMKIMLAELLRNDNDDADKCIDLISKIVFRDNVPGLGVIDERTFAGRAREIHMNELKISEFKQELVNKLAIPCNVETMINQFNVFFSYVRSNKGFHRWWGLKFFLMEYENYLQKNIYREDLPHVQWDNYYEVNIEHIMPQNYRVNWQKEMDDYLKCKDLSDDMKEMAKKILINTLGNLTILKDAKNSSLQDDSWEDKRKRYESGSFNELNISKNVEWNQYAIFARGRNMIRFLESMVSGLKLTEEEVQALLFVKEPYYVKESI